jgi:hypothetical protein
MKYIIYILTLLLFLCGLFIFSASLYGRGIGFFTPLLTTFTLIGLITSFFKRKLGWTIIFITAICWLLRYFEHASYLILYDFHNSGRWLFVSIPILLSFSLFGLIYKVNQREKGRSVKIGFFIIILFSFLSIGLLSFIRKPFTDEFNCWYYITDNKDDLKITFAKTPDQILGTTINSPELKSIIMKEAITDEFRDGYYCPETKVRVITSFKKIIGLKILGFRNTKIDKIVKFHKPFRIESKKIEGDMKIIQPDFDLGD